MVVASAVITAVATATVIASVRMRAVTACADAISKTIAHHVGESTSQSDRVAVGSVHPTKCIRNPRTRSS